MKQAENNQIDTLLRNLARRERAAPSGAESAPSDLAVKGAHLDIDELSSYAERALPPSARARCTAHLADCDDCRKIVAQLSLAAGPLLEEHNTEGVAGGGLTWIRTLSKFFSPPMLRYATPALVLVVLVVAFFGWRQQRINRSGDFVALNPQRQLATAANSGNEKTAGAGLLDDTNGKTQEVTKDHDQKEAKAQPTSVAPSSPVKTMTESDGRAE